MSQKRKCDLPLRGFVKNPRTRQVRFVVRFKNTYQFVDDGRFSDGIETNCYIDSYEKATRTDVFRFLSRQGLA